MIQNFVLTRKNEKQSRTKKATRFSIKLSGFFERFKKKSGAVNFWTGKEGRQSRPKREKPLGKSRRENGIDDSSLSKVRNGCKDRKIKNKCHR
uniref:Uncharacterized protein n=1 Tax=Panagrolaimus sp. JU765 TaxID=591449 RepID=A0AC34QMU6_9BILA